MAIFNTSRGRGSQQRIGLDGAVLWRPLQTARQPDPPLGNPEQKAKYLPKLISGEPVSFAMSETGAGSGVVLMNLKTDEVAGGYRSTAPSSGSQIRHMKTL